MLKKSQYVNVVYTTFILAFLLASPNTFSGNIQFNISFSEFILKNASPLISQIENQKGLGYNSLKKQITDLGCNPDVLLSPAILEQKEAYQFHSNLMKALEPCAVKRDTKKDIKQLLSDKEPYLIIAGESLKSPMSYFGHSLLLFLDEEDFYFSPVISVLAPTENLTATEQLLKGGFLKIPAEINAIPLHQILDSYNNRESRKLKFIKLPDSHFDKDKIIGFFDDKLSNTLTYNFFTENCSTYLYEALAYSCNCFDEAPNIITPVFLEKKVQETVNTNRFEINSLFHNFNTEYKKLSAKERVDVSDMFSNPKSVNPENGNNAGKVAVLASRLSFESYGRPNDSYGEILDTFGKKDSLQLKIPLNQKSDDRDLDGLSVSSAKIYFKKDSLSVQLSAVDFDHFEQRSQHYLSSKLTAGVIEIYEDNGSAIVETLDILNIRSVTPLNFVTRTPSWKLRIGADRTKSDTLQPLVSAGLGAGFNVFQFMFYSLPSIELSHSVTFPIYSGIEFKSDVLSIKYETKNNSEQSLTLYKRQSSSFSYEYKITKHDTTTQQIAFSYYF
ncbi:lipoprotein N-acyltransferase Lnb domain-containing protein [Marinomonas shanghaiensis]|uniref:lipoprotein N-acyltransferase Lnb domain-containing protein n=1 Tax=Marinomonas shanghaiensis TaxID=2202418 RepID=UPI000DB97E7B|nr:DUF4105 domain-containing protein [Marinomonas shanghaiensis]